MGDSTTVTAEEAVKDAVKTTGTKITLPSGKVAEFFPGKGSDAMSAQRDMGEDSSKYLVCLMSRLVEIDGRKMVPEDFAELPLSDFMKLQTEFATTNF